MRGRTRLGGNKSLKIVVLGPDCGGKSTLAKLLSEHYDIEVQPNRRIEDDLEAAISVMEITKKKVADPDVEFILDQWHYPVDIVYNKTLRDTSSIMETVGKIIFPYLHRNDVLFLHVDAEDEELERRFNIRGDELWDIEQIKQVAQAYRIFLATSLLKTKRIDTTDKTPEEVLTEAITLIDEFYGR